MTPPRHHPSDHRFGASRHRQAPIDQAHGLRRLFARAQVRFVPVVSNPHAAFGGLMLERLCTAFGEHGVHTLVVDASERAAEPSEMALLDLADCIERLSSDVSYLPARGLPLKFVDATGSTQSFLTRLVDAAPGCGVVLLHAAAPDLCRLLQRRSSTEPVCPLLLADDRPTSVTHAYGSMKLMSQRAGWVVHELLLGAADRSPRAERIAAQLASCADDFLGAVLRDWAQVDPETEAIAPPGPALRRLVRSRLGPAAAAGASAPGDEAALRDHRHLPVPRAPASSRAFN